MKLEKIILVVICILTFSCTKSDATIMYVANEQMDCVGVAPQKCLQIKLAAQDDWTFFYDSINGFQYEPGFYYKLEVSKSNIKNPAADASSVRYELVKVLEKSETFIEEN